MHKISGITYAVIRHMRHAAPQLKTGDVVQLIRPSAGVPAGTRGIIVYGFTFDPLYDIRFDGYAAPRLVHKRDVAAAPLEVPAAA